MQYFISGTLISGYKFSNFFKNLGNYTSIYLPSMPWIYFSQFLIAYL